MLKMLQRAVDLAATTKDQDKNFFLGCIGLRKDGVYVCSTNETIVTQKTPSSHAEARALRKCGQGSILWVARVLKDKVTWANAKPCMTCRALIINKMVDKIYYTIGPNEYGVWIPRKYDKDREIHRTVTRVRT